MRKVVSTFLLATPLLLWGAATPTRTAIPAPKADRPEISVPSDITIPKRTPGKSARALAKSVPEGTILQGYQNSTIYGIPVGMYRFNTDAETELLYIDQYTEEGYNLTQGWMRDGRLCVMAELYIFGISDLRFLELDPYTGKILKDKQVDLYDPETEFPNYLPYHYSTGYDPSSDRIYGYGSSENGQGYAFYSAPGNDPSQSVCVSTPDFKEMCVSVAFNTSDGYLYGINRNDDFVKISPETGEQTVVMPTGLSTRYAMAGMLYNEKNGKFLLNTLLTDYTTGLAEIDPVAKSVTQLCNFDNLDQFPFIYTVEAADDPNPIKCPEIDEVKFGQGKCSGYISYFIPSEYFTGGSLSGELSWYASVDGKPYSDGTVMAGDIQKVEFSDLTIGKHTFDFYVEQGDYKSSICSKTLYVGYDTPLATASVTLTETKIEWEAVTRCVNNGYLDPATLKYHVYVNDEEVGVTSDTYLDYTLPVEEPYASYKAKVVVDNMGMLSKATSSSELRCGKPWLPDFNIIPTAAQANVFSAYDLNQDKSSWVFYENDDDPDTGVFYGPYSTISQSDDWLFTPPIALNRTDVSYEVSYDLGNFSKWYPDIEVGVYLTDALDPRNVVATIQEKGKINNAREYVNYTHRFTVNKPGTYYIAFFCDAEIYQNGIRLKNIDLKKLATSAQLPAAVTDLKAEGAPLGELKAAVDFNLPDKYISGETIPESVEVTAKVKLGENEVTKTGAPGTHISLEIPSEQGFNQLTVTTFIQEDQGNEIITTVFTGVDVPGPVSSLDGQVSADNLTLTMRWTAPTAGENGYYINPDDVVYNLMVYGEEGWEIAEVIGKNVYEYEYSVPEGSPQATAFVGIAPSTVAGVSNTVGWLSDVLGTPYELPVKEVFADASFEYRPIRIIRLNEDYYSAEWGVVNPRLIDPSMDVPSEIACYGRSEEPNTKGMLMLPKFNLQGVTNPGIIFECWTGVGAAQTTIYAETFDSDGMVKIGSFPTKGNGWQTVEMPFPADFDNHQWVAIYIDAYFKTVNDYVLFSSYEVRGGVSGLGKVSVDGGILRAAHGEIIAEGFEGKNLAIYSLDGITLWNGVCHDNHTVIPVNAGTYIVKVGSKTTKIVAR